MSGKDLEVNLNDIGTVTLSERGIEAIETHYRDMPPIISRPKYETGDTFEAPLWEIMHIFGPYTYMGPPPPFETQMRIRRT